MNPFVPNVDDWLKLSGTRPGSDSSINKLPPIFQGRTTFNNCIGERLETLRCQSWLIQSTQKITVIFIHEDSYLWGYKAQLWYRSSKSAHHVVEPARVGKAFQNESKSFYTRSYCPIGTIKTFGNSQPVGKHIPASKMTLVQLRTNVENYLYDVENANWIDVTFPTLKQRWYYVGNLINQNSTLNRRWNNVEILCQIDEYCIDVVSTFGC